MSYQVAVNVRSSEYIATNSNKHDDSDSAEDDHFYLARPPTISCYGLPYLDHTYGAPWPSSPPPPVAAAPAALPRINGHIDIDNVSYHAEVFTTSDDNQYADSVTRCICGFLHDDGYMICCDKCGVWQHVDCMGVEREHIPEVYLCEVCQPRFVDRHKAMLIQRKRYELLTAVDVEAVDVSDDSQPLPLARDLNNLLPLRRGPKPQQKRIKILKRSLSMTSGLKPLHRHSKFHRLPGKLLINSPSISSKLSPRMSSVKCAAEDGTDDYYQGGRGRCDDEVDVEELPGHRNTYSSEVAGLLRRQHRFNGQLQHTQHSVSDMLAPLRDQLCRVMPVGPNIKGLQVLDDVETSRPLIEYTGSVRVDDDGVEDSASLKQQSHPHVLIYSKFESTQLRIESGAADSDAKYVRRSCKPNAEIRHVADSSTLRFFVFSARPIFRGQEITIPFDMEYTESDSFVCGCGRIPCPVLKSTSKFSRLGRRKKPERDNGDVGVDLNKDVKSVTGEGAGVRRRQREDSGHDGADARLSASDGAAFVPAAALSKRRGSDETASSRVALARRRKRLSCVDSSEEETVINVEETGRRQSLGDRMRSLVRERRASGSDRTKLSSVDDRKAKAVLEHSVSCTSPKDEDDRKMSREERKLEAIMKAFERMEKRTVKRRDSVSKPDGPRILDRADVKAEIKEEEEEVEDIKPSIRLKKDVDIRKSAVKKLKGRHRSWLTMKRDCRKSSNVSSQSSSTSVEGGPVSLSVPSTPHAPASDLHSLPFKFPKTKKAMMSEWLQEKTLVDRRLGGGADDYKRSLTVDTSEDDDMDRYVNYIQTPSRHADMLKNVRRTSTSSSSSKGSPASIYLQQGDMKAGSAKKRWLHQVMTEKSDGDSLTSAPLSPGDAGVSLASSSGSVTNVVAPLKKRRLARESTSEEAATLLSLANSVPALEYEQLDHSRMDVPSSDLPPLSDNLSERFNSSHVSLAEQLLALRDTVSADSSVVADRLASTITAACGVDEKADGFRLLLEGIEQAAARERASSMQVSPPISASSLPASPPPIAHTLSSLAQPEAATSAEPAAVVDEGQCVDNDWSLSCDSSAVATRCSDADAVEVCSSVELTGDASAELLHSTSDVQQGPVDIVVSSCVSDSGYPQAGSTVHSDGVDEAVSCSEEASHHSDLDPDCPVSSSRRYISAISDYSNEAAASSDGVSPPVTRRGLLTFRHSVSVDDARMTEDDVSSSGSMAAAWPECSSAVSSSRERKKVSLLEYRNRMRERSSSSSGSNVLLSPRSDSGAAALAEPAPDAGVSESSSRRERRESTDVQWNAEATAAERLREHGDRCVSTVHPRSTPASGVQPATLPSLASSAPATLLQHPADDGAMSSEAMSAACVKLDDANAERVTTCLAVHTVISTADHSLTSSQLYEDLSPTTSQPRPDSADQPRTLPHDQCTASSSLS